MFDLKQISKYRSELMGLAAIAILLCHAPANIPSLNSIARSMLSALGIYGNPTFFFLSGVGLYFSLDNNQQAIESWYKKRFLRLFLPYFFISFIIKTIMFVIGKISFGEAILYLIGVSYWKVGNGAWFVWALVPMYLFAPIIKKIFDFNSILNIIFRFIVLCLIILSPRLLDDNICQYIGSIQQVCSNFPAFIIGMWSGKYIKSKSKINLFYLLLVHVVLMLIRLVFDLKIIPMVIFAVCPSVLIGCYVVRYFTSLKSLFNFFGGISLESYLFNTLLPGLLICIPIICNNSYDSYRYLLVVVIGVALSKPMHVLSKRVEKILYNFKKD